MSLVPEQWALISSGKQDGLPTVVVTRVKHDFAQRVTTWKLQLLRGQWRVKQIFFSQPNLGLDRLPNRLKTYSRGIKLSDSIIDQRLLAYCDLANE